MRPFWKMIFATVRTFSILRPGDDRSHLALEHDEILKLRYNSTIRPDV